MDHEHLKLPGTHEGATALSDGLYEHDNPRLRSRSPHPYHQQSHERLQPSDTALVRASSIPTHQDNANDQLLPFPAFSKDSTPITESGTEADDETYMKRLPPSKTKLHKGLRGRNEVPSGPGTPLLTPAMDGYLEGIAAQERTRLREEYKRHQVNKRRRNRELGRRGAEVAILGSLAWLVLHNPVVEPVATLWQDELRLQAGLSAALLSLYPLRLTTWAYLERNHQLRNLPLSIPTAFDPAPLLYPQVLTVIVAFLTASNVKGVVQPSLILGVSSIPRILIPSPSGAEVINHVHWLLTCVPLGLLQQQTTGGAATVLKGSTTSPEDLSLLYPLHQTLCSILRGLTKDSDPAKAFDPTKGSLLPTEIQLLSISLINLWLLSTSPQAVVLKAILWVGGLGILVLCGPVVQWSINLARVPKWRLRRNEVPVRPATRFTIWTIVDFILSCIFDIVGMLLPNKARETLDSGTDDSAAISNIATDEDRPKSLGFRRRCSSLQTDGQNQDGETLKRAETASVAEDTQSGLSEPERFFTHVRRHTLPFIEGIVKPSKTHTPAGRRKRAASSSIRYYFGLTPEEAIRRKWLYAAWVYLSIIAVVAMIDVYVKLYALHGSEPFGWAIGYLFGDNELFRSFVTFNLGAENWILLPARQAHADSCHSGWVQKLRHASYGAANTRLLIAAWWISIVVIGLAIVFQLSKSYEVDTRRKVFHFMMVSMFLPATFVDPNWCSLALTVVLAVFLLLDMLRASQLPPLSTPIKNFLQPYVDGRDYQGPVVVSHIFLLIGCSIPLWLSLASLPRAGAGHLQGWDVPTRELSMVAGVVCVGLGDAAASLVGRRWGVHKWWWGGGKSLEGSLAFAVAVFFGLLAANFWLKIGGWPITNYSEDGVEATPYVGFDALWEDLREYKWTGVILNTGVCASVASLTEAVLTGGNDNVVVPVVLWTCVKAMGL